MVNEHIFGKATIPRAARVAVLLLCCCAACQNRATPTQPTMQLIQTAEPGEQTLVLGQIVGVTLDGAVSSGGVYCEVGGDPAPCARFSIDVPQAGTLIVHMDFEQPQSMFLYLFARDPLVPGGVRDLVTVDSTQSPLVVRQVVERGTVHLHAGLNVGWALRGQSIPFQLVATLE